MNKAFIKESDGFEQILCPGCESVGVAVGNAVLDQHVQPEFRAALGDHAWFCRYAGCPVAYFNNWAGQVLVSSCGPVYPKSPDAPLCSCFPFSMEEIEADAQESVPHRIRELYAKSKGPAVRCCSQLAPDGQCCLTEIQRLYFRLRTP